MPSVEVVDDIAAAFGLSGYHLQMPDFKPELFKNGQFEKILHAYADTDDEGRRVMETTAEYITKQHHHPANTEGGGKGNAASGS